MKIPNNKIESFVVNPDRNILSVLIYGPDSGLVAERAAKIGKTVVADLKDPFRVVEFSFNRIKDEPALLSDEINAFSLTGGRRLIKIRDCGTSITDEIAEIIERSSSDSLVIFTAEELAPTSSLRKFFESANKGAAIPCYKDDSGSIRQIIQKQLYTAGISCDNDALNFLSGNFAGDRMVINSEIEKLITYAGNNKQLTLSDVWACIGDNAEISMDDLCNEIASRNSAGIEKQLKRVMADGVVPVVIIRAVLRYIQKLHLVKCHIKNGMGEQEAVSALRPPVFFKQLPILKKHLSEWNIKQLEKIIDALIKLEMECKTTGNPAELLCARFITIIPAAVRR